MTETIADTADRSAERPAHAAPAWSLGAAPGDYLIVNVRVVLAEEIVPDAEVVVRAGRIAAVRSAQGELPAAGGAAAGEEASADARAAAAQARRDEASLPVIDGAGLILSPGFIDLHSDALEKERSPRPSAEMPLDFAIASFEGRVASAGITTIFHGAGFQHQLARGVTRSVGRAIELCEAIDAEHSYRVDHRVLHRFDILSEEGAAALRARLDALPDGAPVPLVSHEDHTPGQGQYADPEVMREYMIRADGLTPDEADERLVRLIREGEEKAEIREANFAWLAELAAAGRIRLLGHDPDSAEAVDGLAARGGAVAEFPTTVEAAARAREIGMTVVAGAPNALRGESHSGNVSAGDLVRAGLVDALASDYLPTALLGGVERLVSEGALTLPQGLALITSGPARVAGLDDRGLIEVGRRADFALLDDRLGSWPRVVGTLLSAESHPESIGSAQ